MKEKIMVVDSKTGARIPLVSLEKDTQLEILINFAIQQKLGIGEEISIDSRFKLQMASFAEMMNRNEVCYEALHIRKENEDLRKYQAYLERELSRIKRHNKTWGVDKTDPIALSRIYEAYLESLDEL